MIHLPEKLSESPSQMKKLYVPSSKSLYRATISDENIIYFPAYQWTMPHPHPTHTKTLLYLYIYQDISDSFVISGTRINSFRFTSMGNFSKYLFQGVAKTEIKLTFCSREQLVNCIWLSRPSEILRRDELILWLDDFDLMKFQTRSLESKASHGQNSTLQIPFSNPQTLHIGDAL